MILDAHNLQKSFDNERGPHVLKGVSLKVKKGESIAIMGRSGEGKSTLLQILGTLDEPLSGVVLIDGIAVTSDTYHQLRSEKIGFVFQSFHLLQDFSVMENLLMPARIARRSCRFGSKAYQRAEELLVAVGMADRAHQLAKQLSGGEKQRVAIARALLNNPDLILADEPSGNLDFDTAAVIHDLLLGLVKKEGKTLILVTHNDDLAQMCDHRYTLQNGQLIEQMT